MEVLRQFVKDRRHSSRSSIFRTLTVLMGNNVGYLDTTGIANIDVYEWAWGTWNGSINCMDYVKRIYKWHY
jgi:hypothetical protein